MDILYNFKITVVVRVTTMAVNKDTIRLEINISSSQLKLVQIEPTDLGPSWTDNMPTDRVLRRTLFRLIWR